MTKPEAAFEGKVGTLKRSGKDLLEILIRRHRRDGSDKDVPLVHGILHWEKRSALH